MVSKPIKTSASCLLSINFCAISNECNFRSGLDLTSLCLLTFRWIRIFEGYSAVTIRCFKQCELVDRKGKSLSYLLLSQ